MKPKFKLGREVMTSGCSNWALDEDDRYRKVLDCIRRHCEGDWGEVCPEDAEENEAALKYGDRILSVYTVDGRKIWIITEADRSSTTVLFPSEY